MRMPQEHASQFLDFSFTFQFDSGVNKRLAIRLYPNTLQLIQPDRTSYPSWTALAHHKCRNCPLNEQQHPHCPAATSLIDVVELFGQSVSIERVHVTIETEARTYVKHVLLPEAVSSLIGILMVTSGCPVAGRLRPMVRHHLPFATLDETKYRVLSMYLLAQYLVSQHGQQPDWELKELPKLYHDIHAVNMEFFKRLAEMQLEDANLNALVRLDVFADAIAFSIDEQNLDDLEGVFRSYLEQA